MHMNVCIYSYHAWPPRCLLMPQGDSGRLSQHQPAEPPVWLPNDCRAAAGGGAAGGGGGGRPQPVLRASQVHGAGCRAPRQAGLHCSLCYCKYSRAHLTAFGRTPCCCCRVLPEPPALTVPPEAAAGLAWHPRALYAKYDAWQLARRAKRLFQSIAPRVGGWGTVRRGVAACWKGGCKLVGRPPELGSHTAHPSSSNSSPAMHLCCPALPAPGPWL